MAPQRPATYSGAVAVLLASLSLRCSAAPAGGRAAQTLVGPDGALTQVEPPGPLAAASPAAEGRAGAGATAAVAVETRGQALLAAGAQQLPTGHAGLYGQPAAPAWSSSGAPPGSSVPVSSVPVSSAPASSAGPPCLVPMWDEEAYVCKEHEEFSMQAEMPAPQWTGSAWSVSMPSTPGSVTDSLGVTRVWLPDASKCTVTPPGKWSFWMASEVTEMVCKAGVWVDGKGKPILEIEMKTAQWFFIISAVAAAVAVYLLYKMFYDTESGWYTWRRDQAVKWGFAKAPPPPAQDAGGDAGASGPQPAININIANASGSQRAPEAQPR